MEFKKVFISELKPAKYNPRKDLQPSDPEYQRIKKSIDEFGYVDPVIINADYTVIGGHQRVKVLKELGHAQIDVVVVDIPKNKEKALNVALNKITGEWDFQQLSIVLSELKEEDFDISITGFTDKELKDIDAELFGKEIKEDDYQPPPEIVTDIKRGDIYQLGRHRLMCGDSTSKEDVGRLMDGKKADMVFTSPPYNAGNNHLGGNKKMVFSKYKEGGDDKPPHEWLSLIQKAIESCKTHSEYQFFNIQQLAGNKIALIEFLYDNRAKLCDTAIWAKGGGQPAAAKNVMNSRFEFIFIFSNEDNPPRSIKTAPFHGTVSNVYYGNGNSQNEYSDVHAATFPIHLPAHFISNFSRPNSAVLDPFLGSGTTLIACEQLDRVCYGMEISQQYCEVVCQRWEKLTGQKRQKVSD